MINFIIQRASTRLNALLIAFLLFFTFPSYSQDCSSNFDLKKLKKDNVAYQIGRAHV